MPTSQYDKEATYVQEVLETIVPPLERTQGFVQRTSKLGGVRFVQMLVLACLGSAQVTLSDMVAVGATLGLQVSVPGLQQRLGEGAVRLLQAVLAQALERALGTGERGAALFGRFEAVYRHDSSYISVPASMVTLLRGVGGNASAAGAKIWLSFEYLNGRFGQLRWGAGVENDQGSQLPAGVATPGSLHFFDLGFFSQALLTTLGEAKSYFVCRFQYQTALFTLSGARLHLEQLLADCRKGQLECLVLLGATAKVPVRLLCQRVPQEVADQRRAKASAAAKRHGRTPASLTLRWMEWNLSITNVPKTNVPKEWWGLEQVLAVYKLRWQIELLFKLFKSQAGLDQFGPWRPERVLCQLYARLIGLVIAQRLLAPLRFAGSRELSLPKAFHLLQRFVPHLILALAQGRAHLAQVIATLSETCLRLALKNQRRKDPSTYDFLFDMGV